MHSESGRLRDREQIPPVHPFQGEFQFKVVPGGAGLRLIGAHVLSDFLTWGSSHE